MDVKQYQHGLRFVHLCCCSVDRRANVEERGQNKPVHELSTVV